MGTFGLQQTRDLLTLCDELNKRDRGNYFLKKALDDAEEQVKFLKSGKSGCAKKTIIVGVLLAVALIAAFVCLGLSHPVIATILFIASVVIAIVEIVNIVALIKQTAEYNSAVQNYTVMTSPKMTDERNAKIAENSRVIEDCKRKLAYANEIYGQDANYVLLYNESTQNLTDAGKMASEIIRTIDSGIANNIPSAVQYIKQKEQMDSLIAEQKRTTEAQKVAAQASLLAAQQAANAATAIANASAQSAKAAASTQKSLENIDRNTRGY